MSETPASREQLVVCAGRRRIETGQMGVKFYPIGDAMTELTGAAMLYRLTRDTRRFVTGGIYLVKLAADGTGMYTSQAQYKGKWEARSSVATWEAETRAEEVAHRLQKEEADGKRTSELKQLLKPLRVQYSKLDTLGQQAMEVAVLRVLRTRVSKQES